MLSFCLALTPLSAGFVLPTAVLHRAVPRPVHAGTALPTAVPHITMGLFDGLAKAFENDDTLGDRKSAGLSKEKAKKTVTWVGPNGQKKSSTVVPGQSLREIARVSAPPAPPKPPTRPTRTPHRDRAPCPLGVGHQDQVRL